MNLNIVLLEPEIPQNTGNIARTCAATGANLHLIKPLGFSLDDKYLKRAGLDYWYLVKVIIYDNLDHFFNINKKGDFFFATTKATQNYTDANYKDNSYIFFGKETAGLPKDLLENNNKKCIRIPMIKESRSLNLANSVAVIVYEALRQNSFFFE